MARWRFFLDETGDHGLGFIDSDFPIFLLAGCLIKHEDYEIFCKQFNELKIKYFGTPDVIMHSRDIRKHNDAFAVLFDLGIKQAFYDDLNAIIQLTPFTIIGSGVDKLKHVKAYGKAARNPYEISLGFVLERLVFYLDEFDASGQVEIQIEKRGNREDSSLLNHYNGLYDRGTYYVGANRIQSAVKRFDFVSKRDNINGLQLADLCAYPLARHCLNSEIPNLTFEVIKPKIKNKKGRYMNYGLKLFP